MTSEKGILRKCSLPDQELESLWERIVVPQAIKDRLLTQVLLEFTVRKKINAGALPLHGLIMLVGPPGTGKTSLARGLAAKSASTLDCGVIQFLEVEPHGLTSATSAGTPKELHDFLITTLGDYAKKGPTIVLLDEVETLAVDRAKIGFEVNPIEIHRTTDAVLSGMDYLAMQYPELMFIATSNFQKSIDGAFFSRADLVETIEKPTLEACRYILSDSLTILSREWPDIKQLIDHHNFSRVADKAYGLDGRQIRKAVLQACAVSQEVAMNPNLLKLDYLLKALELAKRVTW